MFWLSRAICQLSQSHRNQSNIESEPWCTVPPTGQPVLGASRWNPAVGDASRFTINITRLLGGDHDQHAVQRVRCDAGALELRSHWRVSIDHMQYGASNNRPTDWCNATD